MENAKKYVQELTDKMVDLRESVNDNDIQKTMEIVEECRLILNDIESNIDIE